MSDQPIAVTLDIDPQAITYGEYKKLLKSQEPDSGVSQSEAWAICEKIVKNKEKLDDLPMLDVVPAILGALEGVFGQLNAKKAKN